jgi:hypothetical protein
MKISSVSIHAVALLFIAQTDAFSIVSPQGLNAMKLKATCSPYFMEEVVPHVAAEPSSPVPVTVKKEAIKKSRKPPAGHNVGPLSPVVLVAKAVLGDDELKKVRAKAIGLHSDVIGSFVNTHDTFIGNSVSKAIFAAMDKNNDGVVDQNELADAFQALGFSWLKEKQTVGILKRADKDNNGLIDYEEFKMELPKTLRTNLMKLAKKNGGDLGFLV